MIASPGSPAAFCMAGSSFAAFRSAVRRSPAVRVPIRKLTHRRNVNHPPEPAVTMCKRSEEHTSELQSLMRISYAVFCLKKKKQKTKKRQNNITIDQHS